MKLNMTTDAQTTTTPSAIPQQQPQATQSKDAQQQARRGSKDPVPQSSPTVPNQSDYRTTRGELERELNTQLSLFVYMSSNAGSDSKELAEKLTDVGHAFRSLGKHRSELRYMQKALEMRKRLYDGDQMDIAESLLNLGIAYANNGEPKYELRYKLEALRMFKRLKDDEDHLSLADALYQVALAYRYVLFGYICMYKGV